MSITVQHGLVRLGIEKCLGLQNMVEEGRNKERRECRDASRVGCWLMGPKCPSVDTPFLEQNVREKFERYFCLS